MSGREAVPHFKRWAKPANLEMIEMVDLLRSGKSAGNREGRRHATAAQGLQACRNAPFGKIDPRSGKLHVELVPAVNPHPPARIAEQDPAVQISAGIGL